MAERNVILISGSGTTMQEMIKASQEGSTPGVEIAGVIASSVEAKGIEKAKKHQIPVVVVNPEKYRGDNGKIDQNGYANGLLWAARDRFGATVFTQNGHLPLTPEKFIEEMGKIGQGGFNQHPGRVPDFGGKGMYGRRVHAATLLFRRMSRSEEMWTEPIVQRVHPQFDKGQVIRSQRVDILKSDAVDDLQERALPVEHELNIQLLKDIGSGTVEERPLESILLPGQEAMLHQAKQTAILLYPKG